MPPFTNYYPPTNPQIQALQQQIGMLQSQLQSQQQQLQQAQQQHYPVNQIAYPNTGISTHIVDSFDSISANEVPMDNNGALFAKKDGSEIQLRRWSADGKIMTTPYKPVYDSYGDQNDEGEGKPVKPGKYALELSDEATQALMARFDEISGRLDTIEQNFSKNTTKTVRSKKEVPTDEQ